MVRHTYISTHIPSGQQFRYEADFESDMDFLRHLNRFNWIGQGEYIYRSSGEYFPPHCNMENQSHGVRIGDVPTKSIAISSELDELLDDAPTEGC